MNRLFAHGLLPAVVVTALLLAAASPALDGRGNQGNPGVLPPQSHAYGKSYGEWSAEWWQWAMALPVTGHPLFDQTGADAAAGQSGPVWFLGGTFVVVYPLPEAPGIMLGQATRDITVPPEKALFFPILNVEWDNAVPPVLPVRELRANAKANMDLGRDMTCTIDGRAVKGLSDVQTTPYRVTSPVFGYTLPAEDNLYQHFGLDVSGRVYPAVGDGVYLMLEPLSLGQHTIHFTGRFVYEEGVNEFQLDITYNITVAHPPCVFPPHSHPYGKSYAEWSAEWWKWAVSMPLDHHPLADTADCSAGQSGHVWFLGGSFISAEVVRNCTVPRGKALFFPILNTECSTVEPDPFHGNNAAELRACAKGWVDGASGYCAIDGVPVQNLEQYRVQSPLFTFGPLPPNNVLFIDVPPGTTGRSVSDGYWLMLAPLSVGQHTIDFVGVFANGFTFHITYNLTVEPGK